MATADPRDEVGGAVPELPALKAPLTAQQQHRCAVVTLRTLRDTPTAVGLLSLER